MQGNLIICIIHIRESYCSGLTSESPKPSTERVHTSNRKHISQREGHDEIHINATISCPSITAHCSVHYFDSFSTNTMFSFRQLMLASLLASASAFAPMPTSSTSTSTALNVAVDTSDIKNGLTVELDGEPYKVLGFSIMKQARGAAKTTIKFKNLMRGTTIENTVSCLQVTSLSLSLSLSSLECFPKHSCRSHQYSCFIFFFRYLAFASLFFFSTAREKSLKRPKSTNSMPNTRTMKEKPSFS